ncbi:MAG: hypothetical protein RL701_4526 [Pseudomonadota bacterium]|jgi:hypothetical protein
MAEPLATYSSDLILITVGGVDLDGYADGSYVTITRTTDAFSSVVGSNGSVVRSKNNDNRHRITIRLLQTSSSNDVLSAISNLDQSESNGAGIFNLSIRDIGTGRARYEAASAWIAKEPDVTYDRTAQPREWTLETDTLRRFDAGSSS